MKSLKNSCASSNSHCSSRISIFCRKSGVAASPAKLSEFPASAIKDKYERLKKIKLSFNSSESAAISFYINTVVSEISNEGIRHSVSGIYGNNEHKFNLRNELMEIVKSNKTKDFEKYYEQLAIKEIEEFAQI